MTEQQVLFPKVDQAVATYLEKMKEMGWKTTVLKDGIKRTATRVSRTVCIATPYSLQVFRQSCYEDDLYLDVEQSTIWIDEAELFMEFVKENSPS